MTNKPKLETGLGNSNLKLLATGITTGATLATAGILSAVGISAYFARKVVVPHKRAWESTKILGLGYPTSTPHHHEHPTTIVLEAEPTSLAPGTYGFYFRGGKSFARIGKILSYDPIAKTVTREVEKVINGDLRDATVGRLSGDVDPNPREAGFYSETVGIELENGTAPAWLIHPQARGAHKPSTPSKTWGIMIHGMGVTRAETLRALDTTQTLGISTLHISYRNDYEANPSIDGRYGLGLTEWHDVEKSIEYALDHGAENVILFGWSMGGSIALQTADHSAHKKRIRALILDAPAVDWLALIRYQSKANGVPLSLHDLGVSMITHPLLTIFTGLKNPLKLEKLSWVRRSHDIKTPTLIIHSVDDTYVPSEPARKLARKSKYVDFVPFYRATHTREWNVDPERWATVVTEWIQDKKILDN